MIPSDVKSKIINTYASHDSKNVELEARFGYITKHGFKPGVTRQIFNRIKEFFDRRASSINIKTTDYIQGSIRKTVTSPTNNEEDVETIWISKDRLWNHQNRDYPIRYAMSHELPIDPIPNNLFQPELI